MKKPLLIVLTLAMLLSLCACGGGKETVEEPVIKTVEDVDWEAQCSSKAKYVAQSMYKLLYDIDVGYVNGVKITTVEKNDDGTYLCYGTIDAKDKYNKPCYAEFSISCGIDLEMAQSIIDNGGIGEDPEDTNPYYKCVEVVDSDYGDLKRK